jgi:dihydroxyacetone kinase
VLNVNFGFANYGHLSYYSKMAQQLTEKKLLEKEMLIIQKRIAAERSDTAAAREWGKHREALQVKIDKLQDEAKQQFQKVTDYK